MRGRILVAVGDDERRSRTVATLGELPDIEVVGSVMMPSDVALVVEDTSQEIDFLLLDTQLDGASTMPLCRQMTAVRPDLGVILMADQPSADFSLAALESGARGVVPTRPSVEDVQARIAAIEEWQRRVRSLGYAAAGLSEGHGRTLVLAGAKGGVGVSTIALHLALLAAHPDNGLRVCLVDFDLQQRGMRHLLDMHGRRTVLDLAPVAENLTARHVEEAVVAHYSGLHVLLAPHEPERADEVTADIARHVIGALRSQFDLVVVDAGSVVTDASAVAMDLADDLILVVTPDVPALRAARETIDLAGRLEVAKVDDVKILFNKTSPRSEVQPELGARIATAHALRATVPADWKHLEETANGATATDLGDSPLRRALLAVARELRLGEGARAGDPSPPGGRGDAEDAIDNVRSRRRGRRAVRLTKGDRGQTTIELVFGLVVAAVLLVLLMQIVLYAIATVSSRRAADAAAQIGSRTGREPRIVRAQEAAESRVPGFLSVHVSDRGNGTFAATVHVPQIFPLGDLSVTQTGRYTD